MHDPPNSINGLLSRVPVSFWLPPTWRPMGGFEFVERASASITRAIYLMAGVLWAIGGLSLAIATSERQLGIILYAAVMILTGVAMAGVGFVLGITSRVLRYDAGPHWLRLIRLRGDREVAAIEAPLTDCVVALHPVHSRSTRSPDWNGFAVVVHIRDGKRRGHFAIGAFKAEAMAKACVEHLPEPLKSITIGTGPKLQAGVIMRLQSLKTSRASRARCPNCGFDLASVLDRAARCPECGWGRAGETTSSRVGGDRTPGMARRVEPRTSRSDN